MPILFIFKLPKKKTFSAEKCAASSEDHQPSKWDLIRLTEWNVDVNSAVGSIYVHRCRCHNCDVARRHEGPRSEARIRLRNKNKVCRIIITFSHILPTFIFRHRSRWCHAWSMTLSLAYAVCTGENRLQNHSRLSKLRHKQTNRSDDSRTDEKFLFLARNTSRSRARKCLSKQFNQRLLIFVFSYFVFSYSFGHHRKADSRQRNWSYHVNRKERKTTWGSFVAFAVCFPFSRVFSQHSDVRRQNTIFIKPLQGTSASLAIDNWNTQLVSTINRQQNLKKHVKMSKTNGHADGTHEEDKLVEVPQYSLIKFR